MKRKPLRSVQSLFKALIYGAACLFLLSVFSCSDEMNMGSLNFGGDLFDGIQKDLSSDCLVKFSDDGYNSCHVKMPFKKTYTKDALIDFFKKNRLLSAVNPGYYPENWKFDGLQDAALDASTNIDKSRFHTDDVEGCISVLTVPPYDFILVAGSWKIRTDTPYTVVFLFQSAEDTDMYEQLASHQPFILFGGTGVAFDDAFANTIYTANQGDLPPGFEFERLDPSSDTEIKADGTSVLKIRLKRKFVKILFYTSESSTEPDVSVGGLYGQSVSADSAPKLTSGTKHFITGWKDSEENIVEIPETFPADSIKLYVASSSNNLYLDPSASSSGSGLTPSSPFNTVTDLNAFIYGPAVFGDSGPSPFTIRINFLGTLKNYYQITELKPYYVLCRYVPEGSTADFAILSPETTVTLEELTFDGGAVFGGAEAKDYASSNTGISSAASLINLNKGGIGLTLKNCTLKNNYNTSDSQPGGAVTCTAGSLVLENCTITFNYGHKGGGVYISGTNLDIMSTNFTSNAASSGGGAVYINYVSASSAWANIKENSEISGNWTEGSGGGIYQASAGADAVQVQNVTVKNNTAKTQGGGIYVAAGRFLTLDNSVIDSNKDGNELADDVYVSGILKIKTKIATASIKFGSENSEIRFIEGVSGTAPGCSLTVQESNVGKQIFKWYDSNGAQQAYGTSDILGLFTYDSSYSIGTDGILRQVSSFTLTPELNYGEIELGNLSGRVWSKSLNNEIKMTLSDAAKAVINNSTVMTAKIYYIEDDKLVEKSGGVGVDGYTAVESEEFKLAFAETLDVGVYTLVISASDVRISTFSCAFTVTY